MSAQVRTIASAEPAAAPAPVSPTARWVGALAKTARIDAEPERIFPIVIDEQAALHGDAPALIGTDETLSHAGLAARQNRYARWAIAQGLAKGDTVALLQRNCPDYLAIWLGLTRVGVRVALLNTNLRTKGLAHCIKVAAPKLLIADVALAETLAPALSELEQPPAIVWQGGGGADTLAVAAADLPGDRSSPAKRRRSASPTRRC